MRSTIQSDSSSTRWSVEPIDTSPPLGALIPSDALSPPPCAGCGARCSSGAERGIASGGGGGAAMPPLLRSMPFSGGGGADGGDAAAPPSFGCGAPPRRFKSDINDLLFNERNQRLRTAHDRCLNVPNQPNLTKYASQA